MWNFSIRCIFRQVSRPEIGQNAIKHSLGAHSRLPFQLHTRWSENMKEEQKLEQTATSLSPRWRWRRRRRRRWNSHTSENARQRWVMTRQFSSLVHFRFVAPFCTSRILFVHGWNLPPTNSFTKKFSIDGRAPNMWSIFSFHFIYLFDFLALHLKHFPHLIGALFLLPRAIHIRTQFTLWKTDETDWESIRERLCTCSMHRMRVDIVPIRCNCSIARPSAVAPMRRS